MKLDVARARTALGLTQQQLADKIGLTVASVAGWEAGRFGMRSPTQRYIESLLRDAGHDPSEFLIVEAAE